MGRQWQALRGEEHTRQGVRMGSASGSIYELIVRTIPFVDQYWCEIGNVGIDMIYRVHVWLTI